MADTYYDYNVDPWDSDTPDYIHVQSAYYSGSFYNITAPASANFPVASPTRYFLKLPGVIDVSDLAGARPVAIYDVNSAVTLTPVSGSPGANEYRLPPSTSNRRNVIEINSGQAGHVIGFDFYMIGSRLRDVDFNTSFNIGAAITSSTVTATTVTGTTLKANSLGLIGTSNSEGLFTIGGDTTSSLSMKGDAIAHGITTYAETDTFFKTLYYSAANGGAITRTFTEDVVACNIDGFATNADTAISTAALAPIVLRSRKKSGTASTNFSAGDNLFCIADDSYTRFIVQQDGDLYTDSVGGAGGAGDATVRFYDKENDIMLAKAAQKTMGNQKIEGNLSKYKDRLEELGIIKNGFVSHHKMMALNLGTVTQIFNIIKKLAEKLNISEEELFEMAK